MQIVTWLIGAISKASLHFFFQINTLDYRRSAKIHTYVSIEHILFVKNFFMILERNSHFETHDVKTSVSTNHTSKLNWSNWISYSKLTSQYALKINDRFRVDRTLKTLRATAIPIVALAVLRSIRVVDWLATKLPIKQSFARFAKNPVRYFVRGVW